MANVHDAMKKHEAEQAARATADEGTSAPPPQTPEPPSRPRPHQRPASRAPLPRNLVVHHDRGGTIAEQYRSLWQNLRARLPGKHPTFLVTSALPGEGKTITCLNLALVVAEDRDRRTVVLDANLRRPQVSRLLGCPLRPGLAEVLRDEASLASVVYPTAYPNLFVVPSGGARRVEIARLLSSPALDAGVSELRRRFDYLLLDTAAVRAGPDTGILGQAVDKALLVARMNKTRSQAVARAIALLHSAGIEPAGLALTRQRP